MKKLFLMFLALLTLCGCSANNGVLGYAKTAPVLLVSAPPLSPVAKVNRYQFLLGEPRWCNKEGVVIEEWEPTEKMPFFDMHGVTVCPLFQDGFWTIDCNGTFQLTATVDQARLDKDITAVDQTVSVYVGCPDYIAVAQGKVSSIDLTLDGEQTLDVSFEDSSLGEIPTPHTGVMVTLDTTVTTKKETNKYSCSESFVIFYDAGACEDTVNYNSKANWSCALDETGGLDVSIPFVTMENEVCLELINSSEKPVSVSVAANGKTENGKPKLTEIKGEDNQSVMLPPNGKSRLFVKNDIKNKHIAMVLDIGYNGEEIVHTYSPLISIDTTRSEIITQPKK